ncbi:hypothetical protein C8R46DRAFT_584591 [Mycena filopes]|nr:hypothetical protein C8R46DRAFT_584591 [Mycena filopes]
MRLCDPHILRWARTELHTRSLTTSAALNSTYRGYTMHGTLREWALRMIHKEEREIKNRSDRTRLTSATYEKRLIESAEALVDNELRKQAKRMRLPKGRAAHSVATADRLLAGVEDPSAAGGWEAGAAVVADRRGRLREALRLYMLASQRFDGSLPVLGSRMWGTTRILERRILKTKAKLDTAEYLSRTRYARVQEDTVNWGITAKPTQIENGPVERAEEGSTLPDVQLHTTARGLAYKTQQELPPLHRLSPSAVERARMPLLQAFPGVGAIGGHVLSLGHASYASRGLLGTPTRPSSGPSLRSDLPPPPSVTSTLLDAAALRPPPWHRRGKPIRWIRDHPRRKRIALNYYPAPPVPPPLPPTERSGRAATYPTNHLSNTSSGTPSLAQLLRDRRLQG